jgi:hypothetical protein
MTGRLRNDELNRILERPERTPQTWLTELFVQGVERRTPLSQLVFVVVGGQEVTGGIIEQ